MAEIGAALREARTRARIEIAQMEAQTKIRAKYLRALENEEWDLLPGPTYVKSFLKTYGDMLGLDGRQLVADYKRGNEPFQAEGDIGQLSKHTGGRINRQQAQSSSLWRTVSLVVVAVIVIAGGAYAFSTRGGGDSGTSGSADRPTRPITQIDDSGGQTSTEPASVVVTATKSVTVCVRAGRRLIVRQDQLRTGQKTKAARGQSVIVTATNRSIRLMVDGRTAALPDAPDGPITVKVTAAGVTRTGASTTACRV